MTADSRALRFASKWLERELPPRMGFWLPLGLMLIAVDVPFLQRPMARLTMWGADRLDRYRERRAKRQTPP
jgi:hypothetical protein